MVYNSLFGPSVMAFKERIGQGPFLRVDLGFAWHGVRIVAEKSDLELDETTDMGFGFLIGGGYGHPITPETRIMLNANYALRRVEEENTSSIGIALNGLW